MIEVGGKKKNGGITGRKSASKKDLEGRRC